MQMQAHQHVLSPRQVFFPEKGKKYRLCQGVPNVQLYIKGCWHLRWSGNNYIPNPDYTQKLLNMGLTPLSNGVATMVDIPNGVVITVCSNNTKIMTMQISASHNKNITDIRGKFKLPRDRWNDLVLLEI